MANESDYNPLDYVPDSLLNHPELVRRGIAICDTLKPVSAQFIQPSTHIWVYDDVGS